MPSKLTMPRLSETLTAIAWPRVCQRCGSTDRLTTWRECDDQDRCEMRYVILCGLCEDRVIGPHPRLYHELGKNQPAPGVMAICADCPHQSAGRCGCPLAAANGGTGLRFPPPDQKVHLQIAGPRGRTGRWIGYWDREPTECEGKEAARAKPD